MTNTNAPRCGSNTCVELVQDGDLTLIRSTRRTEFTAIPFDGDEIVKFIDEVKAGAWDGVYARATAAAARMTSA